MYRNKLWGMFLGFVLAVVTGPALAQPQISLPISTGSETGSYFRFIRETAQVCSSQVRIENRTSTGSPMNLDRLEANDVSLGVVQTDVLNLYANTKDMSNIKVLVPLFPEQLHFVTRAALGKEGGYGVGSFRVGQKEVVLNTVEDLNGRKLAAAGGSYMTAQVVQQVGQLGFQLFEGKTSDDVLKGVANGTYDAGLLVCAQPCPIFQGKKPDGSDNPEALAALANLKLLPVTDKVASSMARIYTKASALSYKSMGQGGQNVPALQVMSSLVTQDYKKGARAESVAALRQCLWEMAPEQAATPGTHPAWRNVKPNATSNWPMWEYAASPSGRPFTPPAKK